MNTLSFAPIAAVRPAVWIPPASHQKYTMEEQYLSHGYNLLTYGNVRPDRTNTGTRSIFGHQMRCNLMDGFPLLTSKFVAFRLVMEELRWFLRGSTNNTELTDLNVHIWDEWALKDRKDYSVDQRRSILVDELALYQGLHDPSFAAQATPVFQTHEELNAWAEKFRLEHTNFFLPAIPTYKAGPKEGELGPVYGKQWRSWASNMVYIKDLEPHLAWGANCEDGMQAIAELVQEAKDSGGIDQMQLLIDGLRKSPYSRRHIVTGWNPNDMPDESLSHAENVSNDKQALPPCHTIFQFYVRDRSMLDMMREYDQRSLGKTQSSGQLMIAAIDETGGDELKMRAKFKEWGYKTQFLDCQLYQRSADWFLGVPFNIASYSLLTMMLAQTLDMLPGEFVHTFGDSHLYGNHVALFQEQLKRAIHPVPQVQLNAEQKDIFGFQSSDFKLVNYVDSGRLAGKVAV